MIRFIVYSVFIITMKHASCIHGAFPFDSYYRSDIIYLL